MGANVNSQVEPETPMKPQLPTNPRFPSRGAALAGWPIALLLAVGCRTTATAPSPSSPAPRSPRERQEDSRVAYDRIMSHEHHALDTYPVRLLDGVVEGQVGMAALTRTETADGRM